MKACRDLATHSHAVTAGQRVRWCDRYKISEQCVVICIADCIPIVGAVKSLVQNDKRFNYTKVWCTFIFIDLQGKGDCVGERFCGRCSDLQADCIRKSIASCPQSKLRAFWMVRGFSLSPVIFKRLNFTVLFWIRITIRNVYFKSRPDKIVGFLRILIHDTAVLCIVRYQ